MNLLIISAICIAAISATKLSLPTEALQGNQDKGVAYLSSIFQKLGEEYAAEMKRFKPVNDSCAPLFDQATTRCVNCVKQKCTARTKSVCRPAQWQVILGKTILFAKNDIPHFFAKSIPNVFANKIGGSFSRVPQGVGTATNGVVNAGKTFAAGTVNVGRHFANIGKKAGNRIAGAANTAANAVVGAGRKVGNVFQDFGKWVSGLGKRSVNSGKRPQPSCAHLERNATDACSVYLHADYCQDCAFTREKDCPGWKAANDRLLAVENKISWTDKMGNNTNYFVREISFSIANMNHMTGGYKNVFARVEIFGKAFSFTIAKSFNPYLAHVAGPLVAKKALDLFKAS